MNEGMNNQCINMSIIFNALYENNIMICMSTG